MISNVGNKFTAEMDADSDTSKMMDAFNAMMIASGFHHDWLQDYILQQAEQHQRQQHDRENRTQCPSCGGG